MSKTLHFVHWDTAETVKAACGIDLEDKNYFTSRPSQVNCENCMASIVANKMAPLHRSGISMTMANQIWSTDQLKERKDHKKGLL